MKLAWCAIALAFASAGAKEKETWPLTSLTAIQIGLDNSEIVRVIAPGKQAVSVPNCFPPPPISIDRPKGIQIDRSSVIIGRLVLGRGSSGIFEPRFVRGFLGQRKLRVFKEQREG